MNNIYDTNIGCVEPEISRLAEDWQKGHHIQFRYRGKTYFAYKEVCPDGKTRSILCDDGLNCGHRVVETELDLFDSEVDGLTVRTMLQDGEIVWIY